ncbi:MAG: site-2 protease family protein [Dehalococcoidia bacterium]|nr:site-2 protease family protein [Dehalococcoidia bacterium]
MRSIRLGSLLGIPLHINPGWFLICGLTIWVLAARVFPTILPRESMTTHIAMALVSAFIFFASIVLHELAHSVVAKRYGIPVRSITLFIFGGVAHITREAARPLSEMLMAASGPLLSIVLGAGFLGVWFLAGSGTTDPVSITIFWVAIMNLALGIFNFLPAFPMDGGRVFRSIIWLITGNYARATSVAGWTGRGFGWSMIGLGGLAIAGFDVFLAAEPIGGIWLYPLIGLFLDTGARRSLVQLRYVRELQRFRARDLMLADPPVAEADRPLGPLARGVLEINPRVCYFVEDRGALAGILSAFELRDVPESLWDTTTAREAMVPSSDLRPVDPELLASDVLVEMENEGLLHAPVVEQGRVIGIIARERILGVLRQAGLLPA